MGVYTRKTTSVNESGVLSEEYTGSILDLIVENQRNETNMFNSVISMDFIEAYSEAGDSTLSIEDKGNVEASTSKNIVEKIKQLLTKLKDSILDFLSKFWAKIKNLLSNDAKTFEKYKEGWKSNKDSYKLKKYDVLSDPEYCSAELVNVESDIQEKASSYIKKLDTVKDGPNYSSEISDIAKEAKEDAHNYKCDFESKLFGDKKENYTLSKKDQSAIERYFDYKTLNGNCEAKVTQTWNNFVKDLAIDRSDDSDPAKFNAVNSIISAYGSTLVKAIKKSANCIALGLSKARKAYVTVAKGTVSADVAEDKDNSKEAKQEAVWMFDDILGEASDIYVESVLSMEY